jgi:hypothetical protein
MTEHPEHTQDSTGGASDAFRQFGDDLAASLRREFEELREEAGQRARAGARGAAYLTAAAVSGVVATGAMLSLPVLALRRLLGPGPTAVAIGVGAASTSSACPPRRRPRASRTPLETPSPRADGSRLLEQGREPPVGHGSLRADPMVLHFRGRRSTRCQATRVSSARRSAQRPSRAGPRSDGAASVANAPVGQSALTRRQSTRRRYPP